MRIIAITFLFALSALAGRSNNPVALADPFIMLYEGTYYAYGTSTDMGIEVFTSDDLETWKKHPTLALHRNDSWGNRWFWAPEVYYIKEKNTFFMYYYSVEEHIAVATSDSPLGPFIQEVKQPMLPDEKNIDNTLFIDDDGIPYMYFDRFNDGLNIWVAEMEADLQTLKKETLTKCINVSQPWEEVWPRVNEGCFITKHNGLYYMTYSANSYESQLYGIGYAIANNSKGPWTKYAGNPILQKPDNLVGVGHSAMFRDKEGHLKIVFHAHYNEKSIHPRLMYIADVEFTTETPPVMKVTGEIMQPYQVEDTAPLYTLYLKTPGNPATAYHLQKSNGGVLRGNSSLPVEIICREAEQDDAIRLVYTITAKETVYYNFETLYRLTGMPHNDCLFYMPGFWYRRNLRSPAEAPSYHTADSWQVREDRLSSPLTGIYNEKTGDSYTVLRLDKFSDECLTTHKEGEAILSGKTSLGFTGFRNNNGMAALTFGFPYSEAPRTYIRKLTLAPAVQTFEKLEKGETRELVWEVRKNNTSDFSSFVADTWHYTFDALSPREYSDPMPAEEAKARLTNFFTESYVDTYELKYFSGIHLLTYDCISKGGTEVGFIGRVLLNAFNALEYGEGNNRPDLVSKARSILDSYLEYGFTPAGFFRELVEYDHNKEATTYSIRRQSEGVFAILYYLDYEKRNGRKHPRWEEKIKALLGNFMKLQHVDGSFPRKFDENFQVSDPSGGSTPSATLPLVMAYKYFGDKAYLESARRTAGYLEKELISKADYFSSTLDANCEDKEASLYASTAMYYLTMVTKGKEREHYVRLCKEAAYFCLSWYYMWDVPFAQGQMLGDVGFQSRGWGNVSVENNHVDVFIFEFATILNWLADECNEPDFARFAGVIQSSMLQLMPVEGNLYNIAKPGYYPEVVQHTNWDYGKNGKGFYNDYFAPGWTVASLWQMLTPDRVSKFFNVKDKKNRRN